MTMSKTKENQTGTFKSHAERLAAPERVYHKDLVADYQVRGTEEVVENGRIVKKSVVRTIHPQDNFSGFKTTDFALENIMAAGALDSLVEGQLSIGVTSELADHMEGSIDNVINAVDAAEAASAQPNQEGEQ